jgi:hypothetical protein
LSLRVEMASERDPAVVVDSSRDAVTLSERGDGFFDFSGGDPGCAGPLGATEDPACDDGFDNDGDGTRDADGGGTGLADAACFGVASNVAETVAPPPTGCGIGPELALGVPLLAVLRRRLRAAR